MKPAWPKGCSVMHRHKPKCSANPNRSLSTYWPWSIQECSFVDCQNAFFSLHTFQLLIFLNMFVRPCIGSRSYNKNKPIGVILDTNKWHPPWLGSPSSQWFGRPHFFNLVRNMLKRSLAFVQNHQKVQEPKMKVLNLILGYFGGGLGFPLHRPYPYSLLWVRGFLHLDGTWNSHFVSFCEVKMSLLGWLCIFNCHQSTSWLGELELPMMREGVVLCLFQATLPDN